MSSVIPFMPDWPVLRHLTWREAHLFEVGLWPGVGIVLALHLGEGALVVALFSLVRRRMHDKDQHREGDDRLRGYTRDAWYLVLGALTGLLIGAGLVWTIVP